MKTVKIFKGIAFVLGLMLLASTTVSAEEMDENADKMIRFPHFQERLDKFLSLTDAELARLSEARELVKSGDFEAAKLIFDELGIERPGPKLKRFNFEKKFQNLSDEDNQLMENAREMMRNGDFEGAKNIFDELGFEKPRMEKRFKGMKR